MSKYTSIIGIAQRITHEECDYTSNFIYELGCMPSLESVKRAYAIDGIRWNALVENDVNRVLSGYEPEYFLSWRDWIELYRSNHHIHYVAPKGGTISGSEVASSLRSLLNDPKEFGYQMWCESGWACPKEQAYFYKSDEWTRAAKAQRHIDGHFCWKCGRSNQELHVHHERPIKSAYSYKFIDNFTDWGMTLYCKECHDWFHENFARAVIANDFIPHSQEEMEADRRTYRLYWKRYHDESRCEFCNRHGSII